MKTPAEFSVRPSDIGVLINLANADRRWRQQRGPEFVRPMDVGRAASAALARLARAGMAVSRPRDTNHAAPGCRPSRQHLEFKITPIGLQHAEKNQ